PPADPLRRDASPENLAARAPDVETREVELDELVVAPKERQGRVDALEREVPLPRAVVTPAETDRAVRDDGLARRRSDEHRLPLGVLARIAEIRGAEEAVGDVGSVTLAEGDEERE